MEDVQVEPVYDKILVEVETEWRGEEMTAGGIIKVALENEVYRLGGAQTKGVIRKLPRAVSDDHYILKDFNPLDFQDLRVGDIVYFHFNEVDPDSRFQEDWNSEAFHLVKMEGIFCTVRDGDIRMFGGRVLLEPVYDDEGVSEGLPHKRTATGLFLPQLKEEKHNIRYGILRHIGRPNKGQPELDIKPGDVVYYAKDADLEYEIEGKKYLVMVQEDLLMIEE